MKDNDRPNANHNDTRRINTEELNADELEIVAGGANCGGYHPPPPPQPVPRRTHPD